MNAANWFHHEISGIVLAGFAAFPNILQVAEPPGPTGSDEVVDVAYKVRMANGMVPVVGGNLGKSLETDALWKEGGLVLFLLRCL